MTCRIAVLLVLPLVITLSGCGRELEMTQQQSRVVAATDADQVLLVAADILRREFGRVRVDRVAGVVESAPVEFNTTRESGTARDLYRGRSTMRRAACLSVGERGGAVVARLRIDIERQDTARALAQPPTQRVSDQPAYTPIERDAATTERQNTLWTKVRRDRRLERALLEELCEEFAPPAAEEAAPAQPAENPAGGSP